MTQRWAVTAGRGGRLGWEWFFSSFNILSKASYTRVTRFSFLQFVTCDFGKKELDRRGRVARPRGKKTKGQPVDESEQRNETIINKRHKIREAAKFKSKREHFERNKRLLPLGLAPLPPSITATPLSPQSVK